MIKGCSGHDGSMVCLMFYFRVALYLGRVASFSGWLAQSVPKVACGEVPVLFTCKTVVIPL